MIKLLKGPQERLTLSGRGLEAMGPVSHRCLRPAVAASEMIWLGIYGEAGRVR